MSRYEICNPRTGERVLINAKNSTDALIRAGRHVSGILRGQRVLVKEIKSDESWDNRGQ